MATKSATGIQARLPSYRVGKTKGTAGSASVLQNLIGVDLTKLGQMSLEDVQHLSATAEAMKEQVQFAKAAAKKIKQILKDCQTIEEIRAEVAKAGLDKYKAINEIIGDLTQATHQGQIDEKLLQQRIQNGMQIQSANAAATASIEEKSLANKLLKLRKGTALTIQQMNRSNQQAIRADRQRIIESERYKQAKAQYYKTMNAAMEGNISASQARGTLGRLKKALTAKW